MFRDSTLKNQTVTHGREKKCLGSWLGFEVAPRLLLPLINMVAVSRGRGKNYKMSSQSSHEMCYLFFIFFFPAWPIPTELVGTRLANSGIGPPLAVISNWRRHSVSHNEDRSGPEHEAKWGSRYFMVDFGKVILDGWFVYNMAADWNRIDIFLR